MKILCNTMSEKPDKQFVHISEFMNWMNNVDGNVPMDDDANDPWDHVQDQNKEPVFMIIASAKVATDEIADNKCERWEQDFTTKLAIKATKVKNDAFREEIEKVRKYDNAVDDQNHLDVHGLNKQVEILSKAMAILVFDKKNNNNTRPRNDFKNSRRRACSISVAKKGPRSNTNKKERRSQTLGRSKSRERDKKAGLRPESSSAKRRRST